MTNFATKALVLTGLAALLLGAGHAATAQGNDHAGYHHRGYRHDWRHGAYAHARHGRARHRLQVLHAVYGHEIKSGHPAAAMRAHLRAKAIRARLRARRAAGG